MDINDPAQVNCVPVSLYPRISADTALIQLKEVYELLSANYVEDDDASFRFNYSAEFLKWCGSNILHWLIQAQVNTYIHLGPYNRQAIIRSGISASGLLQTRSLWHLFQVSQQHSASDNGAYL